MHLDPRLEARRGRLHALGGLDVEAKNLATDSVRGLHVALGRVSDALRHDPHTGLGIADPAYCTRQGLDGAGKVALENEQELLARGFSRLAFRTRLLFALRLQRLGKRRLIQLAL